MDYSTFTAAFSAVKNKDRGKNNLEKLLKTFIKKFEKLRE